MAPCFWRFWWLVGQKVSCAFFNRYKNMKCTFFSCDVSKFVSMFLIVVFLIEKACIAPKPKGTSRAIIWNIRNIFNTNFEKHEKNGRYHIAGMTRFLATELLGQGVRQVLVCHDYFHLPGRGSTKTCCQCCLYPVTGRYCASRYTLFVRI